ncbi:MAG: sensor histidine kinase [Candidatus Latescibacteria bacterium]|nr:sensor histidine kinase [Candidatus Latescibacterota bacterium]
MAKFTVDTHLFRELGELLVGRDSTALIELIKNAYDADATEVTVYGERLDNPEEGHILVTDDGVGMNTEAFTKGFLRVASRLKELGERRSILFQRRYTGAKGIGRLAAHKLAKKLEIDSVPQLSELDGTREALNAIIDWDKIEQYETLDELDSTDAILLETKAIRKNACSGTALLLSRLRRAWTKNERARFLAEVQSFDPPSFLREPLPRSVIEKPLLFDTPVVRDQGSDAVTSPFQVNLEGDFAAGDDYWTLVAEMAHWVLEIRTDPNNGHIGFAIAPTKKKLRENPEIETFYHSIPHTAPERGPHFDARILVREGAPKLTRDQRVWATNTSGVRVYLEGFRVLPYGEPKDDWLSIDADYARRPRQLEMLKDIGLGAEASDRNIGLVRAPSNNYFGAVFLTQNRCPDMRLLVNREGFVPEASFETLERLVRMGIDFLTRERAAASYERRQQRREDRSKGSIKDDPPQSSTDISHVTSENIEAPVFLERIQEATHLIKKAGEHLTGDDKDATNAAMQKLDEVKILAEDYEDLISEHMLMYVLASVGTQMAAFVHEINALLGASQTIELVLEGVLAEDGLSLDERRRFRRTLNVATELKRSLERQASYLMDVVTVDARRRRSRQRLCERFDAAVRLVQHQAERRVIKIDNQIPPELRSPPMFPAEITAIFANLLTNAVKAAGEDGHILASASSGDDQVRVRVQNTGTAVQLDEAERWFKPFQSTTSEVNPVLGQGMGLGLTITRNLLENYGAVVKFIQPDSPFATAVEIALPIRS